MLRANRVGGRWFSRSIAQLVLAATAVGCSDRPRPASGDAHADTPSNLLRQDYAGSSRCAGCHQDVYERWSESPMRLMTRHSTDVASPAPFDGATFRFKDDLATMTRDEAGGRYVHVQSSKFGDAWYRVTKVIGGRYREDYAGVRVAGARAKAPASGEEHILPVSYLLFANEWRYKGYSVMAEERPGLKRGLEWRKACIFCHNTAPTLSILFDDLFGMGAPTYQGAASVELPFDRRIQWQVTDEEVLSEALQRELQGLSGVRREPGDLKQLLAAASETTLEYFEERHLVEVGIGCEACHGGSRLHAEQPAHFKPQFLPTAPFLSAGQASGQPLSEAQAINHTCARCHTVLFSRYPFTWEGGERGFSPGGSSMNSGEARDFLLGACSSQLSCVSCHDPHARDEQEHVSAFDTTGSNRVCTSCHTKLAGAEALERHSHHQTDGEGAVCVNCHMPRKNVGLDYELTRYHRIGSPTDPERVERDRPLECGLCHADKSVGELVSQMERWYQKRYDRVKLGALYAGNLQQNALLATLEHGKPHERVVAVFWLGKHRRADALESVMRELAGEYPLFRFFARDAIENITGKRLALDMHSSGAEILVEARRALEAAP
jgi:predicted CXXCH cytochrome family protein